MVPNQQNNMVVNIYEFLNKKLYKSAGSSLSTESQNQTPLTDKILSGEVEGTSNFSGGFRGAGIEIVAKSFAEIQPAIQTAFEKGGGVVKLENRTYLADKNITLKSNVYLRGVPGTVLDLNGTRQIRLDGTNFYGTGTVAVTNGGTTVTGTGTTFTSAMVGRYILLEDFWYEITGYTSATVITIDSNTPYLGSTLSGAVYGISNIAKNSGVSDMTIKNTNVNGIQFQYVEGAEFRNLTFKDVTNSTVSAIYLGYVNRILVDDITADNCDYALGCQYSRYGEVTSLSVSRSNQNGIEFVNHCRNWKISSVNVATTTAGPGVEFRDCSVVTMDSFSISNSYSNGILLTSGCSNFVISNGSIDTTVNTSTSGILLSGTCDNITIIGCNIKNATGYGVNINASTNDDCIVVGNYFSNNTNGHIRDVGTRTVKRGNSASVITNLDNPQTSVVATQFDKTNTTLSAVSDLTALLTAGRTYSFEVTLFHTTDATGGYKYDLGGGTCTATSIKWIGYQVNNGTGSVGANNGGVLTSLTTSVTNSGATAYTNILKGTIKVNAGGTFIPRFAQVSATGTSSVLVNSTMIIHEIN